LRTNSTCFRNNACIGPAENVRRRGRPWAEMDIPRPRHNIRACSSAKNAGRRCRVRPPLHILRAASEYTMMIARCHAVGLDACSGAPALSPTRRTRGGSRWKKIFTSRLYRDRSTAAEASRSNHTWQPVPIGHGIEFLADTDGGSATGKAPPHSTVLWAPVDSRSAGHVRVCSQVRNL